MFLAENRSLPALRCLFLPYQRQPQAARRVYIHRVNPASTK